MDTKSRSTLDLLPRRGRGRQSPEAEAEYQARLAVFCDTIRQIRSTMDFGGGSRGWGYILENRGLITKGEFDACASIINDCRKNGLLPLDICADDDSRITIGLQGEPNSSDIKAEARDWKHWLLTSAANNYLPFLFFDDLDVYVEMGTEKLDLRNLFEQPCGEFYVPITNLKGWCDLNARAAMMRRFKQHEAQERQCVLLLCGDHDPGGLNITDTMRKNLDDLCNAQGIGWHPDRLSSSASASTPISSTRTA